MKDLENLYLWLKQFGDLQRRVLDESGIVLRLDILDGGLRLQGRLKVGDDILESTKIMLWETMLGAEINPIELYADKIAQEINNAGG